MSESWKAVLAVGFLFGGIVSIVVFTVPPPGQSFPLAVRIGVPALTIACLVVLLWASTRKDRAPDFLRNLFGSYFERSGFCFNLRCSVEEDQAFLDVYYQNRYERPCEGRVVVLPTPGFWLKRPEGGQLALDVPCEGGVFGVVRVPWSIPEAYRGKIGLLDVAAAVRYPLGRGRMLRFRDGVNVGKASHDGWQTALAVAALAAGGVVITRPARIKLEFPAAAASRNPEGWPIRGEVLWRPGDGDARPV